MGEEFILFAAVAGLTLVLRKDRRDTTPEPLVSAPGRGDDARTDALGASALLGIAVTVAFGWYMAMHPHLTPGGGFQGGAITAGVAALLFLGLGYQAFERVGPSSRFEPVEAIGAAGYVVVGIATLAVSGAFLANVLPLGRSGDFFSTGTIQVINGFFVMFREFADETRVEREPDHKEERS
jgi:multicomponent Na+:H+ antiporter subunit B